MSLESYYQRECCNGHYWIANSYDDKIYCPICDSEYIFELQGSWDSLDAQEKETINEI